MKKIRFVFIMLIVLSITSVANAKEAVYPESFLDKSTDVYALTNTSTLIVDKINNQLQVLDISTQQPIWNKKFTALFECVILENPLKIVVLTSEKNNLKKITLSADGNILSQQLFSYIKIEDNQKFSWSPPTTIEKEKIVVVGNNNISLYQYPWKKPSSTVQDILPKEIKYEVVTIKQTKLQWPYFVIKLNGDNSPQSQDFYRIVDLSNKKMMTIPVEWNINSNFTLEGNEIVIFTSSKVGLPFGINPKVEYGVYTKYDLKTGAANMKITRSFTASDFNWRTDYVNNQLSIIDTERNTQTLLDKNGKVINEIAITTEDLYNKFIGYSNGQLFSFISTADGKAELTVNELID
ncbi:hypothetical protein [Paenibacillus sp. MSJ-34]|uniref:hypothetical protein n=1 Tax=Paenibacillus sp. MSJ-34 TaxID=2841529 RepID=UPI001C121C0A|nr:hypothetical protein [Paenibacillus sp. MSJ-34]MBU5444117.1 hypothetical protein [Paenibacillus sp. MSJ-34]